MRVFKFRSNSQLHIDSLINNQIYAARYSDLNDPCEAMLEVDGEYYKVGRLISGHLPISYGDTTKAREEELGKAIDQLLEKAQNGGVYSLSAVNNSRLLWSHYAEGNSGFCIEFDLDTLLGYELEQCKWIRVDYQPVAPTLTAQDLLDAESTPEFLIGKMIGTKYSEWSYEREVRIITDIGLSA